MKMNCTYLLVYIIIIGFCLPNFYPVLAAPSKNKSKVKESYQRNEMNKTNFTKIWPKEELNNTAQSTSNQYNTIVYIIAAVALVITCLQAAAAWLLYYRLKKKKKNVYDEEKAIERSTLPQSKSTTRTKGKKRKKKKKNPVKKPVETIMNEVKSDDVSIKPGPSEEQMQSEERPSEVKKDEIYPEQECVVPDHVSATEEECMVPDEVCAESEIQRGTSPKPKFKRLTILQWIDQDDDDEEDNDEDETNLEQTLQAPEKKMVPLTESQKETSVILDMALEQIPLKPSAEAPTETTLPETSISSPQQDMEAQEEPPMVSKAKLNLPMLDQESSKEAEKTLIVPISHRTDLNYKESTKYAEPVNILVFEDDGEDPIEMSALPSNIVEMITAHIQKHPFEAIEHQIVVFENGEKAIYVTNIPRDEAKICKEYIRSLPVESMHDQTISFEEAVKKL